MKKSRIEETIVAPKRKTSVSRVPAAPPGLAQGGTDRSIAELNEATRRLSSRRLRDMLPGKIETRRLVLRAPIRGDVPDMVKLADNPAIAVKLSRLPSPYTRADGIGFVEIISQRADERPYALTLNDRFIGIAGFSFHDGNPPEFGYWLGEPYWGKGYMTEAGRGMIEAAHATGHFETISARALADNDGSLNVLEKLGFKRIGRATGEIGPTLGKPMILLELRRPRWM